MVYGTKWKRSLEKEKIELLILQQQLCRDENRRAQEKHEQELIALKLKNEILQQELEELKARKLASLGLFDGNTLHNICPK